jgi:heme A synthase
VLWGAFVRATGSGAGCGNHWPLCNGVVTPHSPTAQTVIEFTHRATSGVDLILVGLLVIWTFRAFPRHHPARLGAVLSTVFLVTEALIGAALVLLEHVAQNASANRAYSLSTHLINTLTLLACLSLTAWWGGGKPAVQGRGKGAWTTAVTLALVMLLGVSGAIAALGDTLFPARSLAAGIAQDFDPAASIFVRLRIWHPLIAIAVASWVGIWVTSRASRRPDARKWAWTVLALVGTPLLAGVANLLLLAPVWMQIVHLLLADLLWISLVLFAATLHSARKQP